MKSLESLLQGSPADVLLETALGMNIAPIKDIVSQSRLDKKAAESALIELLTTGMLVHLEKGEPSTS
ncbi:MAG: hypothetical protein HC806_09545, partial [Anaerolineae bacterium]|nr:hypothetical protein [Anaerolineae bacterium]